MIFLLGINKMSRIWLLKVDSLFNKTKNVIWTWNVKLWPRSQHPLNFSIPDRTVVLDSEERRLTPPFVPSSIQSLNHAGSKLRLGQQCRDFPMRASWSCLDALQMQQSVGVVHLIQGPKNSIFFSLSPSSRKMTKELLSSGYTMSTSPLDWGMFGLMSFDTGWSQKMLYAICAAGSEIVHCGRKTWSLEMVK